MLFSALCISLLTAAAEFFSGRRGIVIVPYLIINPLLLLLPRLLYSRFLKDTVHRAWLTHVETINCAILLINAPASLYFHEWGFQYDRFLHFAAAFLAVFIFFYLYGAFRQHHRDSRILEWKNFPVAAVLVGVVAIFGWEGFQFAVDQVVGSQLFHDAVQSIQYDFLEDILFGMLGMSIGLWVIERMRNSLGKVFIL